MQRVKRKIKQLTKNWLVSVPDKISKSLVIICREYAAHVLTEELTGSETYAPINVPDKDTFFDRLREQQKQRGIVLPPGFNFDDHVRGRVSRHALMPKPHKLPAVKFRFLACANDSIMTPTDKTVSNFFKAIMPLINKLWIRICSDHGIDSAGCWAINSGMDCVERLKKFNRMNKRRYLKNEKGLEWLPKGDRVFGFDFTTLFTKISQPGMILLLREFMPTIFELIPEDKPFLAANTRGYRWWKKVPVDGTDDYTVINKHEPQKLVDLIKFSLDNCYISHGDQFYQQIIGEPMGKNWASFGADIYLLMHELKWLIKQLEQNNIHEVMRSQFNCRRCDDIITLCPMFGEFLYTNETDDQVSASLGKYPRYSFDDGIRRDELICRNEGVGCLGSPLSFLDVTVFVVKNKNAQGQTFFTMKTSLFDKKSMECYDKLPVIRYPDVLHAVNRESLWNICHSRLLCIAIINSCGNNYRGTIRWAGWTWLHLINANYPLHTILKKLQNTIQTLCRRGLLPQVRGVAKYNCISWYEKKILTSALRTLKLPSTKVQFGKVRRATRAALDGKVKSPPAPNLRDKVDKCIKSAVISAASNLPVMPDPSDNFEFDLVVEDVSCELKMAVDWKNPFSAKKWVPNIGPPKSEAQTSSFVLGGQLGDSPHVTPPDTPHVTPLQCFFLEI